MLFKINRLYQVKKESTQRSRHQGVIALDELNRLTGMLKSDQAEVEVKFSFSDSEYDRSMVKGHVVAELSIECQRCLKPVLQLVELDFELLIDASDNIVQTSGVDTLYSEDGNIDMYDVVEDELILGLPLVALHESGRCNEYWHVSDDVVKETERENPFLVLEKLKTKH